MSVNIAILKDKIYLKPILYFLLFVFYFTLACVFIGKYNSSINNVFFGADTERVLNDFINYSANHYRTKVHPLYILLLFPIICPIYYLSMITFSNGLVGVALVIAVISTLNCYLLEKILSKINVKNKITKILIVLLFAFSFASINNSMIIEAYLFGTTTLLLFWLVFLHFKDKDLKLKHYLILLLLGILTTSMTITNIFHFLIGAMFLIVFNKKKSSKEYFIEIAKYIGLIVTTILSIFILCEIQRLIFPTSENAITYLFKTIFGVFDSSNTTEEIQYVSFGLINFLNLFIFNFGYGFFGFKVTTTSEGFLNFEFSPLILIYSILLFALFVFAIVLLIKNKKFKSMLPFILTFAFELILHLFYGNDELMIYILQSVYLIVIILHAGISSEENRKLQKGLNIALICFIALNLIFNLVTIIQIPALISNNVPQTGNPIGVGYTLCLIITALILASTLILNSNNHKKLGKIILVTLAIVIILIEVIAGVLYYYKRNENPNPSNLKIGNEKIIFGMGLREKYVLENLGEHYILYNYDVATKSTDIIYDDLTLIEHNAVDYTATLTNNENNEQLIIYENEDGLYLQNGTTLTTLDDDYYVNIPDFTNYEYSDYLTILFNEVMVNVSKNGITPNIFIYGNNWYRDGAMVGMVLEYTNNTHHIEPWLSTLTVDDIYDNARDENLNETDNLGELLYLLSLMLNPNQELINAILIEAENQKVEGTNYISGITDGGQKPVYQTKWLKFGMESLGIDSSEYDLKGASDDYFDLCWWYDGSTKDQYNGDIQRVEETVFDYTREDYPYINLARMHYYKIKIEIPELHYPISYELADYPAGEKQYCFTHSWHATELFFYLLNYENFT